MIHSNNEISFKIKTLDNIERNTINYLIKSIVYSNAEWNSPLLNLKLKYAKEFIDNQIDIVNKLEGDKLLLEKLINLKEILEIKDESVFFEKLLDEKIIKNLVFHLSKKYNKDYNKIMNYLQGKTKIIINTTSEIKEN